jgi:hypothetical protein
LWNQNRQSLIAMQLSDGSVNGPVATSLKHDVNIIQLFSAECGKLLPDIGGTATSSEEN